MDSITTHSFLIIYKLNLKISPKIQFNVNYHKTNIHVCIRSKIQNLNIIARKVRKIVRGSGISSMQLSHSSKEGALQCKEFLKLFRITHVCQTDFIILGRIKDQGWFTKLRCNV